MPRFRITIEAAVFFVEAANEDQAIEDARDQVEIFADLIDDDEEDEEDEDEENEEEAAT